jgi:hypothetical protein
MIIIVQNWFIIYSCTWNLHVLNNVAIHGAQWKSNGHVCKDSCDRFMCRLTLRCCSFLKVLIDTWPLKFNSSRKRADIARRFVLAHRATSVSTLCVALLGSARSWTFINHSSRLETLHKTINYRMVYPRLHCHPYIGKTCLWHATSLPPLC